METIPKALTYRRRSLDNGPIDMVMPLTLLRANGYDALGHEKTGRPAGRLFVTGADDLHDFGGVKVVMLADNRDAALGERRAERLQCIDDALNALISPDAVWREFLGHERLVTTLYRAVKPDPAALEFAGRAACTATIADAIRAKLNPNRRTFPR